MPEYPFLRAPWLQAFVSSGAVAPAGASDGAGWQDLSVRDARGSYLLPLYRKQHSWGEYVFDQSWAQAYARHGLAYYPKLITAVPYTPISGPRWVLPPGVTDAAGWLWPQVEAALAEQRASGWHLLFPDEGARQALADLPLVARQACHFRWFNRGYHSFDDFLAALVSRKRKSLRRERARVAEQGLRIERAAGQAIPAHWWQAFYPCYADTYQQRGQAPYLAESFFSTLRRQLPDQLMLVAAFDDDPVLPVAMALYLFDDERLYGRYWGALRAYDALHFELCYYQGIEFSIGHGLQAFDPGVQGEHKLLRGFEPVITWSLHHLVEPAFQRAVADFCREEAVAVAAYQAEARTLLPFRRT